MGRSVSAYLFYGYQWNEPQEFEHVSDLDTTERALGILESQGIFNPLDSLLLGDREASRLFRTTESGKAALTEYYDRVAEIKNQLGADWEWSGAEGYAKPLVYVLGTMTEADWGEASSVLGNLDVNPGWKHTLDKFLADLDIESPTGYNQPGWWLAVYGE